MEEEIDKGMKESMSAASEDDIFRVKVGYTHPHSLSKEREKETIGASLRVHPYQDTCLHVLNAS